MRAVLGVVACLVISMQGAGVASAQGAVGETVLVAMADDKFATLREPMSMLQQSANSVLSSLATAPANSYEVRSVRGTLQEFQNRVNSLINGDVEGTAEIIAATAGLGKHALTRLDILQRSHPALLDVHQIHNLRADLRRVVGYLSGK